MAFLIFVKNIAYKIMFNTMPYDLQCHTSQHDTPIVLNHFLYTYMGRRDASSATSTWVVISNLIPCNIRDYSLKKGMNIVAEERGPAVKLYNAWNLNSWAFWGEGRSPLFLYAQFSKRFCGLVSFYNDLNLTTDYVLSEDEGRESNICIETQP